MQISTETILSRIYCNKLHENVPSSYIYQEDANFSPNNENR